MIHAAIWPKRSRGNQWPTTASPPTNATDVPSPASTWPAISTPGLSPIENTKVPSAAVNSRRLITRRGP